ncbi:MAG TPA: hypothetical protein VE398_20080 [Acidobacteriota bacterium]|nr:hypothetical protein [Acidobacteriota bacterium]
MMVVCSVPLLRAQVSPPAGTNSPAGRAIGVIQSIDSANHRISLKTDTGPEMSIAFDDATRLLRVQPGAKDLANATSISSSDLQVGDRILARGRNFDAGHLVAASIIVMSKSDLAKSTRPSGQSGKGEESEE